MGKTKTVIYDDGYTITTRECCGSTWEITPCQKHGLFVLYLIILGAICFGGMGIISSKINDLDAVYWMQNQEVRLIPVAKATKLGVVKVKKVECEDVHGNSIQDHFNVILSDFPSLPNTILTHYQFYYNLTMHPDTHWFMVFHLLMNSSITIDVDFPDEINLQGFVGDIYEPKENKYIPSRSYTKKFDEWPESGYHNYSLFLPHNNYAEVDLYFKGSHTVHGVIQYNISSYVYNVSSSYKQCVTPCKLTTLKDHYYILHSDSTADYDYMRCKVTLSYSTPVATSIFYSFLGGFIFFAVFGFFFIYIKNTCCRNTKEGLHVRPEEDTQLLR